MCLCLVAAWAPSAHAAQNFEGTLRAVVTDGFAHGETSTDYWLERNGRSRPVLPTGSVDADDGTRVTVSGSVEEGHIVGDVRTRQAPSRLAPGPRTLAVVLVNFEDDAPRTPPLPPTGWTSVRTTT